MAPSPDVLLANERLLLLRQRLQVKEGSRSQRLCAVERSTSLQQLGKRLPTHLGWGSGRLTAVLPKLQAPITYTSPEPLTNPSPTHSPSSNSAPTQVKHYPSIGIGALKQRLVPHYQLWLACRLLDPSGRGWVSLADLRATFTGQTAHLPLFGWRRMRQIIQRGEGLFWEKDGHRQRLWLFGTGRVARLLKVDKLVGLPVIFSTAVFTEGIGTFKAHLYAAWHSGRKESQPISRQTLRHLTQVPERTQRDYEKEAKVVAKPNLAIGDTYTADSLQERAWERGGALFKFTDWNGRVGPKNSVYHAWQMPNSYRGPHQIAPFGRQRRINFRLTDLVQKGAQGNGEQSFERLYYENGRAAAKAVSAQKSEKAYWQSSSTGGSYQFWHLFF